MLLALSSFGSASVTCDILRFMSKNVKQELLDSMDVASSGGSTGAYGVVTAGLQASVLAGPSETADTQQTFSTDATRGDTQARNMRLRF